MDCYISQRRKVRRDKARTPAAGRSHGRSKKYRRDVHHFHDLPKDVIEPYARELLQPEFVEARIAFRKKMNFICRVEGKAI